MSKIRRLPLVAAAFAVFLAALAIAPSRAPAQPAATIQLSIFKAGFVFGGSGGNGVLYFQGQSYPLSIGGLSVGLTIGAAAADLTGEVYNLRSPYDIQGIYSATQSGYAVAGGDTVAILQNTRGVELHLRGKQVGLEFSIDLSGMSIGLN